MASLLDIPDSYEILFLQGGGSGGFSEVVYHLVSIWVEKRRVRAQEEITVAMADGKIEGGKEDLERKIFERLQQEVEEELKLDYLVTGSWSLKASQEAARLGERPTHRVGAEAHRTCSRRKRGFPHS